MILSPQTNDHLGGLALRAFLRRAMTPSAVTASGSSPCSHFQTARGDTSNSVAASACVSPRRSHSALSWSAKVILDDLASGNEFAQVIQAVPCLAVNFVAFAIVGNLVGGNKSFNELVEFLNRVFHIVFGVICFHFQRHYIRIKCEMSQQLFLHIVRIVINP